LSATGEFKKYELSKLTLKHAENFVLSPVWYESWSGAKRQCVVEALKATLFDHVPIAESPDLMLF